MFNGSTMIILNATAGGRLGGGGFYAPGRVAISTSTVSIQHARAVGIGGGFLAAHEVVIAQRSNVSISDAVTASQGGGFHAQRRLQVISQSILNIQNVKAGKNGGGFSAFKEVEIAGSSTVKISNSQAVSGGGGGLAVSGSMNVSTASTLMILNATALGGAGFYATGKVAIDNSTVNIQHAKSAGFAGGFDAKDEVVIAGRSQVSIWDAAAAESGGGFQVRKHLQVTNKSTLNLQDVKAGKNGGGLSASREVEISGNSTLKIWNSRAVSGIGGGFDTQELRVSNSSLIILNATAGTYGGGVCAQRRVTLHSSTVSIQSTNAGKLGGGFTVADEILIADMSNVTISDAVAKKGGGFHVEKRLQMRSHSTLNLENVEAGDSGGGLYSLGEVDIGGSSTVKISNGHAVSGYGGGFDVWAELKLSNRSTLIVLNVTAGINGGGVSAGGKVAINNSTVSIQNATSGQSGGGFFANGGMALVDASIVAMSDTHAGVDGGGFMVRTALTMHNGSMSTANSSAERTGTAGRVDGLVLLLSQSSLDIHQAEGDGNSSVLAASCLQLHPSSTLALEGVIGGHGLDLQNGGCSSLCRNTTFQVTDGAALNAMGRLSSGLLSVEACPSEEVRLSSIHLGSWNSSLLTTRPSYVVIDNVDIHYRPPVDNLQILAAQENFIINSLAISCPDCPQGVTFNATDDKTLQALSPQNLQCSKASTVSNGLTLRCDCGDYRITSEHFRNTELVSLEDVFQTCRFCNRHSYFQDGSCRPCEIYRAWSDGKRDVCHVLPHESPERVILFMGAAVFVILTFIAFEILHAPLVILDAKSDIEDPSEVAAKRIFTVSVKGPITSLPTSISRLLHQRVRYRARGTGLQWLDFDPQKSKAIKVCSVAQKKFLLQDAHVPFDCASCRGSLHATETCVMVTLLIALLFLLAILPTIIKVAVVSGNGLQHTFVTSVFYIALPMAAVAAVLHWPVAWLIQGLYRRTPFSEALDDYRKQIHCKPHPGPDATHPRNQGLLVLTLRGLWKHFESFILEQNMHFVVANIVRPLTQSKGVSFVTLWGGKQVDYFVSHSWGTSFSHFVHSIGCHALSKEGPTSWMDAAYWICSFANNQWNIAAELADDPMDSAFARALRGGIKGVAMVLDHEVQPLTRVWCLFEFLLSSREQLELVFTTDVGVVGDDGCASFDIALEVGNKIECLEVAKCQASSDEDKRKIFEYIINTLGSLESMDGRIKQLMGEMLKKNLANVGSATDSLRKRLRRK
ncbi:Probable outer membrane protein PmpB (Polymorphic membrane protein B) [Durusdinium trenchii]|uniref:Probable outer membrane protein PmpB (Polymorphic membrane protein B) n=1 Tax=Durusdinium trenchii TaxID=1381693 RepID=A0ABP0SE42_9DINO